MAGLGMQPGGWNDRVWAVCRQAAYGGANEKADTIAMARGGASPAYPVSGAAMRKAGLIASLNRDRRLTFPPVVPSGSPTPRFR